MNTPEQFDAAWHAAQPVEVQLLIHNTPVGDARDAALDALAAKYALDAQILHYGVKPGAEDEDTTPYWVMRARGWYGYTWVPALGQPFNQTPPGITVPGRPSYDPSNPPTGSIKVVDPANCDLAVEYPPAVPPTPAPAPSATPMVDLSQPWPDQDKDGKKAYYATQAGRKAPAGTQITEDGQPWIKIPSVPSIFPGLAYEGWRQA